MDRLITLGVFLGLTLFTFQSKVSSFLLLLSQNVLTHHQYDFSGMGPWLFGGLVALCKLGFDSPLFVLNGSCDLCHLVMTGLVGIFIPFSRTMDIVFAAGGCLLFSGYIVYDTYIINARLSPDEYIMGSISLYLECVSLYILQCSPRFADVS